jgi:hypothetical protein
MQIMSRLSDLHSWLCAAVFMMAAMPATAGELSWRAEPGKSSVIKLNDEPVKLSKALKARLKVADMASFLPFDFLAGQNHLRWLVVRTSSRSKDHAGFCGAGHEDRLVLIAVSSSKAKELGEFLAQSCLSSVSMDVDRFDELIAKLDQDAETGLLEFEQSLVSRNDAYRQKVSIQVIDGRIKIKTRRLGDVE